jgi:hypothetical protein
MTSCHSCVKRRIKCDGTRPICEKCRRKGIECPGYGPQYRFYNKCGPIEQQVDKLDLSSPESVATPALLWPDGSYTGVQSSRSRDVSTPLDQDAIWKDRDSCPSLTTHDDWCLKALGFPRHLQMIDSSARELMHHFSTSIAPVMVVVDSDFNGYRSLLLPMAAADETVRSAVCVASLGYLSHRNPALAHRADIEFQHILSQLRRRTLSSNDLTDLSAWATIIVLLTAETITGGSNFPRLFRVLQHLAAANTESYTKSVVHSFLAEQTRMMALFAQPLLQEKPSAVWQSSRSNDSMAFITNIAILRPDLSTELELYKTAIRLACDLYVARATISLCYSESVPQLDRLQAICERIQVTTPGHHTLVWTYFIAAAESITLKHREFFITRLQEIYKRTGFHNIPAALSALQTIWKVQLERPWTEVLPHVMPVFII